MLIFTVNLDTELTECRQPRRNRKRDLLKRVMSSSHHRSNANETSNSERNSPVRSTVSEFPFSSKHSAHPCPPVRPHQVRWNTHIANFCLHSIRKRVYITCQMIYKPSDVNHYFWAFVFVTALASWRKRLTKFHNNASGHPISIYWFSCIILLQTIYVWSKNQFQCRVVLHSTAQHFINIELKAVFKRILLHPISKGFQFLKKISKCL